jgi:plasmid maintenance system antidote protein VapI
MPKRHEFLDDLEAFENSPEGYANSLRMDLADILLRHLDGKSWTQNKLAQAAGVKPPFLTRVIHSAQNCTFETAATLAYALGVKLQLVEVAAEATHEVNQPKGAPHGEEVIKEASASGLVSTNVTLAAEGIAEGSVIYRAKTVSDSGYVAVRESNASHRVD